MSSFRLYVEFERPVVAAIAASCLTMAGAATADTVEVAASKDNTLIQSATGGSSNGAGPSVFSGRTGALAEFLNLRAVIAFDVAAAIPAGSTIDAVDVVLTLTQAGPGSSGEDIALHRITENWGEGTSNGFGGSGAASTVGDATWIHTFFDKSFWNDPGGDFISTPSATLNINSTTGDYTWASNAALVADVQGWLDNPATQYGWIVIGEETLGNTVKKFASRENSIPENRPRLVVTFTPPPTGCEGDIASNGATGPDGEVDTFDLLLLLEQWGTAGPEADIAGDGTSNPDGVVDVFDLLVILDNWNGCDPQ